MIENTVTNVLELAKAHQSGRATENVTTATISQYAMLQDKVATSVLDLAKERQEGRVADIATTGNNFTERWFRDSGLYDLEEKYQLLELASERRANHG